LLGAIWGRLERRETLLELFEAEVVQGHRTVTAGGRFRGDGFVDMEVRDRIAVQV